MSETIGGWTPQQLAAFIKRQTPNDPTDVPHAFAVRTVDVTENLMVRGAPFEHAVIPRGVTMGDRKGKAYAAFPVMSGTQNLNRAYHAADPTSNDLHFAESYDPRFSDTTLGTFASGTMKMMAVHVPTRERLSHMYINYTVLQAGGSMTYGGYALYGPLKYNSNTGLTNITAVPRVAITPTNDITMFRASGSMYVADGLVKLTGSPAWDIVLEAGIYFACALYVQNAASATDAALLALTMNETGVQNSHHYVPHFTFCGLLSGQTAFPNTLDVTAFTPHNRMWWFSLYDDGTKQI